MLIEVRIQNCLKVHGTLFCVKLAFFLETPSVRCIHKISICRIKHRNQASINNVLNEQV